MILTWWPVRFTQRMFSGCTGQTEGCHQFRIHEKVIEKPLTCSNKILVYGSEAQGNNSPWGQGGEHTSGACNGYLHRFVSQTPLHPPLSAENSHPRFSQTAPHPQHWEMAKSASWIGHDEPQNNQKRHRKTAFDNQATVHAWFLLTTPQWGWPDSSPQKLHTTVGCWHDLTDSSLVSHSMSFPAKYRKCY